MPDVDTARAVIRATYRQHGYYDWNKPKFMRLCAKLNETPEEVGARIGLSAGELAAALARDSFSRPCGILLGMLNETIDMLKTRKL